MYIRSLKSNQVTDKDNILGIIVIRIESTLFFVQTFLRPSD